MLSLYSKKSKENIWNKSILIRKDSIKSTRSIDKLNIISIQWYLKMWLRTFSEWKIRTCSFKNDLKSRPSNWKGQLSSNNLCWSQKNSLTNKKCLNYRKLWRIWRMKEPHNWNRRIKNYSNYLKKILSFRKELEFTRLLRLLSNCTSENKRKPNRNKSRYRNCQKNFKNVRKKKKNSRKLVKFRVNCYNRKTMRFKKLKNSWKSKKLFMKPKLNKLKYKLLWVMIHMEINSLIEMNQDWALIM